MYIEIELQAPYLNGYSDLNGSIYEGQENKRQRR